MSGDAVVAGGVDPDVSAAGGVAVVSGDAGASGDGDEGVFLFSGVDMSPRHIDSFLHLCAGGKLPLQGNLGSSFNLLPRPWV